VPYPPGGLILRGKNNIVLKGWHIIEAYYLVFSSGGKAFGLYMEEN
jgi:hypothetical protein